jgi:integrase
MKNIFPKYKQGQIAIIKASLKSKDKKILDNFLTYCGITAGEKKLKNIERDIVKIYDVMQVSFDKITLDDLRKFLAVLNKSELLEETKNDIKKTLKRFLKEYYKDWNIRFAELKDIKTKDGMNHKKLNANTILTKDELERLIRAAESLRYKALIMLMFESAGRPEEILKLKWGDLDLEKGEVKLHSFKTGKTRVNPIKESILHLKRYKQEYPYPNVMAQDYIFPSPMDRKKHLLVSSLGHHFKELGKRTINKAVFPYLLRHTRATQLQKVLPPKVYEKFMDHSIEMANRYSHLDKNDVRDVMLEKIYHIEELTEQEKEEIKALENEINRLKTDTNSNFELLKKLNLIVQVMLKAAYRDKKTEAYFKKQLKNILPEGQFADWAKN